MCDKIKEDLIKSIFCYYDIKQNTKFLVYFTLGSTQINVVADLNMFVTNGICVWSRMINDKLISEIIQPQMDTKVISFMEFLENLKSVFKADSFDLNHVLDTQADSNETDLVEFKAILLNKQFKFVLKPVKSNHLEIKNCIFALHDRYSKLESENNKLNSRVDLMNSNSSSQSNGSQSKNKSESSNSTSDNLKKFNITNNNPMINRKPGMSIINPLSKRRKTPEGVKFDEDDE